MNRRLTLLKALQAVSLAVALCFSLGASDAGSRFTDLGHRLMCTCGCAQLLGECNHVGCQTAGKGRQELTDAIARGMGDKAILNQFAQRYGATVLAAPPTEGFDIVAWIAPFAVFAAATLGVVLLVRRWSVHHAGLSNEAVAMGSGNTEADRIREQIRRETGADGGF